MSRKTNSVSLRLKKTNKDYNNCWYGDILYPYHFSKSLSIDRQLLNSLKKINIAHPKISYIGAHKLAKTLVCYLDPNLKSLSDSKGLTVPSSFFNKPEGKSEIFSRPANQRSTLSSNQRKLNHLKISKSKAFQDTTFNVLKFSTKPLSEKGSLLGQEFNSFISLEKQCRLEFKPKNDLFGSILGLTFSEKPNFKNKNINKGETVSPSFYFKTSKNKEFDRPLPLVFQRFARNLNLLKNFNYFYVLNICVFDKNLSKTWKVSYENPVTSRKLGPTISFATLSLELYKSHNSGNPYREISIFQTFKFPVKVNFIWNLFSVSSIFCQNFKTFSFFKSRNEKACALFLAQTVRFFLERKIGFRRIKRMFLLSLPSSSKPVPSLEPWLKNFSTSLTKVAGIRISCSGRVAARSKKAQRARKETFLWGETGLHVFNNYLDFAKTYAETSFGLIGVQVWVCYKC